MTHDGPISCGDCGVIPGQAHERGCDIEPCALCGRQLITCPCVYRVSGMDPSRLEQEHPDIYRGGATEEMWKKYDAEVDKSGGRLPWTGSWPGVAECHEFEWYAKRNPNGPGWIPCNSEDPEAKPDLNRLGREAVWSRERRRFERKA